MSLKFDNETETKLEQIHRLTKELGYEFRHGWGREVYTDAGFRTIEQYEISYKAQVGKVRGISTAKFTTLDEVIEYLKEKKAGRVHRKAKK